MGRIKQFILDLTSFAREIDLEYINKYLKDEEKKLFFKLRKAEVLHSINVAKIFEINIKNSDEFKSLNLSLDEESNLIKSALLHDIGKIKYRMNVLQKSLAVILNKYSKDKKSLREKYKIMDVYYGHPEYGKEYLKNIKSFDSYPYLYEVVGNHHGKFKSNNSDEVDRLKEEVIIGLLKKSDEES